MIFRTEERERPERRPPCGRPAVRRVDKVPRADAQATKTGARSLRHRRSLRDDTHKETFYDAINEKLRTRTGAGPAVEPRTAGGMSASALGR